MGNFKEHLIFGFLTAAVLTHFIDQSLNLASHEILLSGLAVAVGAVIPDIDHKKAYVHRAVKSFISISLGLSTMILSPWKTHYSFILGLTIFLIVFTAISRSKITHRGFTHSISFMTIISSVAIISGVLALSTAVPGLALGLGVFSHLLLDREFKMQ